MAAEAADMDSKRVAMEMQTFIGHRFPKGHPASAASVPQNFGVVGLRYHFAAKMILDYPCGPVMRQRHRPRKAASGLEGRRPIPAPPSSSAARSGNSSGCSAGAAHARYSLGRSLTPGSESRCGKMNPLTKVKLINELNEREVLLGVADKMSWHAEYKDSAWIFLGGLPCELTEGDIICVLSQYGEIVNINLVRDKKTGKSKGFCFLCYEDQRSTILAVNNFNGITIKGRTIRVDHVSNYRAPKDSEDMDNVTKELQNKGCGAHTPSPNLSEGSEDKKPTKKHKKDKKEKKKKKKDKEKSVREAQAELPSSSLPPRSKMLKEKDDPGSKKHSSKNSEKGHKSESREGWKHYSRSSKARITSHDRAEGLERESRKEKPRHDHKTSSRREEREEKYRDRERGQSSNPHSSWHSGRSEGHIHRSRSRRRVKPHRYKRARHSWDQEPSNASDRKHH
ncbi:RNA-binding motif protein, X-linked 2-like [Choloepus didactylus]|uniref:RNA-binding motif protein, X-linked 2-like n=1 Tax=Choloepus didactylus TaxID=27675 RepID=UPI00189DFBD6|nr:RNA-binding motif protein, X-linked 2-like [Choloepus didactylus]